MVRGYTTIEQSKKLLELGLDPSTADMFYPWYIADEEDTFEDGYLLDTPVIGKHGGRGTVPCWSLAALLELMPYYEIAKDTDYIAIDSIGDYALKTEGDETLLDVVVNMLCELIEQKHIKVNK